MAQTSFDTPEFKRVLKEALSETLREQRELLYEVFVEVLEDVGLSEAIREGLNSDEVNRSAVIEATREKTGFYTAEELLQAHPLVEHAE